MPPPDWFAQATGEAFSPAGADWRDLQDWHNQAAALFSSRLKKPLTAYAIWSVVKKYVSEAEMEHVSPHSFRHTVATRLVRNPPVGLVTAATFLGHSRLDTTARYAQPSEEDLARAAGGV